MIDQLIEKAIKNSVQDKEVGILMSGGVDSLSLAFASHRLGKKVHVYTFHLEDNESYDSQKANEAAKEFGWDITTTIVPTDNLELEDNFIKLATEFDCKKKTHFECTFPFLYIFPKIKQKYILSGIAADGWYGVSKKAMIHFREPKEKLDKFREDYFSAKNPAGILQQYTLAKLYNKIYLHPYLWNKEVKEFFMKYNHKELHNCVQKYHVRTAYKKEFDRLKRVKPHLNLQLISNIDKLFETLLDSEKINFKNRGRVMDICRDWANRIGEKNV